MSLQSVFDKYQAWKRSVEQSCEPFFANARAQLVAVQRAAGADEKIERIEGLLRAKLEPVLLESEAGLEPLQQEVDQYFAVTESPTDHDSALQEQIGQGVEPMRDRLDRRVTSLVAQARANELQTASAGAGASVDPHATTEPVPKVAVAGPAPPPGMLRFCVGCGAKLGPGDWSSHRCSQCGAAL